MAYLSVKPSVLSGLLNQDGVIHDFVQTLANYTLAFSAANGTGYTFLYPGIAGVQSNFTIVCTLESISFRSVTIIY